MKRHYRNFLKLSGLISLIANLVAIGGFLLDRWPWRTRETSPGFWVVFTFVTTAYVLVLWSSWTWRWSNQQHDPYRPAGSSHAGAFLLNTMAVLPALTAWFYLVLSTLNNPGITTTRWILALAVAWAGTPFIALGLTWTGTSLGPILNGES